MKFRTAVVVIFLVIFVGLTIGGSILALLAFGIGWLVNHVMKLEPFEATLIALLSIVAFGMLAERIWSAILSTPPLVDEDYEDDEDEYADDEDELTFNVIDPDSRCFCGSGRKYKNCHGSKRTTRKS